MSGEGRRVTTVTLKAKVGEPLEDERVRETVLATARGIAERTGVEVVSVEAEGDRVVASLVGDRLAAVGFAAELRRVTDGWYAKKYGVASLWGEPWEGEG